MTKSHSKMIPVAVFDISSSSVAGAHTLVSRSGSLTTSKVAILASTRVLSEAKEDINIERFVESTGTQLEKVITTLQHADVHTPHYIQVVLASPWFVSQTRTITYSKEESFICTQKLIDSLVEKEILYITEHDMEQFGDLGKDALLIEKQLSSIKLNGYSTGTPIGKETKSIELFLVVTVCPRLILKKFEETFQNSYPRATIRFTTSPYATFIVTRDFLSAPKEFLIIDIGEEVTDIACVKNDIFLYHYSFPVGVYELYRKLQAHGHATLQEAHALIESFRLGKLSASMTSDIQKSLDAFGDTWQHSFQQSITSGASTVKLPNSSYIISDYRFNTFFVTLLKNDHLLAHGGSTIDHTVVPITSELLQDHVSSLDPDRVDETLVVAALFASRIL